MSPDEINITVETKETDLVIDKKSDVDLTIDSSPDVITSISSDELNVTIESKEIELNIDNATPNVELTLNLLPDVIVLPTNGLPGPPGPIGPKGLTGPVGSTGSPGPEGPEGPQGIQGPVGAASTIPGPEGPQGIQGDIGAQGPEGPEGPEGPQGIKGDTGNTGSQGPIGPEGPEGPAGADSTVPGPQGPQGIKGDTGDTGATGATGPQGIPGPEGPEGPMGTVYDTDQIGTIKAFSGQTIPTNWMLADGRSLVRTAYPQLADELGVAAGATNFNLPDLRNRFIYGASAPGVGASGGESEHTLTGPEMPYHDHDMSTTGLHGHFLTPNYGTLAVTPYNWGRLLNIGETAYPSQPFYGVASETAGNNLSAEGNHVHDIYPAGGNGAHNNMPPYVLIAHIIKVTGVSIDSGDALVGATGPQGPQGIQGVKGDTGNTGAQGIQGIQGPTGLAEAWFSSAGAPAGATGVIGDWHLNTTSGDVSEKTGTSTWTLQGNLKGPQGIQGIQGVPGPSGSAIPIVTSLPASPADGDEVFLNVAGLQGAQSFVHLWHFKYISSIGDGWKWVFLGGPPLYHEIEGPFQTTSVPYVASTCLVQPPLKSTVYDANFGGRAQNAGAPLAVNLSGVLDDQHGTYNAGDSNVSRSVRAVYNGSGTVAIHGHSGGTTYTWYRLWLQLYPVRMAV